MGERKVEREREREGEGERGRRWCDNNKPARRVGDSTTSSVVISMVYTPTKWSRLSLS